MSSSLKELLGIYVYRDDRSDKFWSIQFNGATGLHDIAWGKNGRPPQGDLKGVTGTEALKRIREKIAKGYRLEGPGMKVDTGEAMKKFDELIGKIKDVASPDSFDFWDEIEKGSKK